MRAHLLLLLVGIGIILIAFGSLKYFRPPTPGNLYPLKDDIVWVGPSDGQSRTAFVNLEFPVANNGGQRVRVLSVESACGCALPRVEPTVFDPRQTGVVFVSAQVPPLGEKAVTITLNTDSPKSPTVTLHFRLISRRTPPYILKVTGDLTFAGRFTINDSRELVVDTVEPPGSPQPPLVRSSLEAIAIAYSSSSERPYLTPDTVHRTYRYRVTPLTADAETAKRGQVEVRGVWSPSDVQYIQSALIPYQAIHVSPTNVRFNKDNTASILLHVYDDEYRPELKIVPNDGISSHMERLSGGTPQSTTYKVVVKSDHELKSPVHIRFSNTNQTASTIYQSQSATIEPPIR